MENLKETKEPLFNDNKVENQIKTSKGHLEFLKQTTWEGITSIRNDEDAAENERRIQDEKRREERANKIESEVYTNYNKNITLILNMQRLDKIENCDELNKEINIQQQNCQKVLEAKDNLIKELTSTLKIKDEEYVKKLKKITEDIDIMIKKMSKQFTELRNDYARELRAIEESYLEERKDIMNKNKKEIDELLENHKKLEEINDKNRLDNEEKFEKELEENRRKDANNFTSQKIVLEEYLQTLEKYLEDMKAVYKLNEEKLDFNLKVLKERDKVNKTTKDKLKKKERRMKGIERKIKMEYEKNDRKYKADNYKYTEDYKRITKQFKDLQRKFRHFEKADKKQFEEIWKMNADEVKLLIDKVIKADKVIHVQQLGIQWKPPVDNIFEFNEESMVLQKDTASKADLAKKSKGEESVTTIDKLAERVPFSKIENIFRLIASEASFLIEEKVKERMKYETKNKQFELQIQSICEALSIDIEDIEILVNTFDDYSQNIRLPSPSQFNAPIPEIEKVENDSEAKELNAEEEKSQLSVEAPFSVDPDDLFKILKEFTERRNQQSASIMEAGGSPKSKKNKLAENEREAEEQAKKNERMYWERLSLVLDDPKLNLWKVCFI